LGLQTQRVDGLSAIGAHPIAAFIKPVERGFAGMQFLQVASRIREVGGGLVIGHRRVARVAMMAQSLAHLSGITQGCVDLLLQLPDARLKPGARIVLTG